MDKDGIVFYTALPYEHNGMPIVSCNFNNFIPISILPIKANGFV